MALNAQGFALLDLPPVTDEILGSYDDLPVDDYMGHGTRFKKFSQYKMTWQGTRGVSNCCRTATTRPTRSSTRWRVASVAPTSRSRSISRR